MNIFQKFFAYLRLREAIRKADAAHILNGARHYVIPASDRRLIILDRSNLRILKRKGYIPAEANAADAICESFYFTPQRDGSGALSPQRRKEKLRQYYTWYAASLKCT